MQAKEQDSVQIITTLNECIASLPIDKLQNVSRIGVSGQMHGVVFWKAQTGKTIKRVTHYYVVYIFYVEITTLYSNKSCTITVYPQAVIGQVETAATTSALETPVI